MMASNGKRRPAFCFGPELTSIHSGIAASDGAALNMLLATPTKLDLADRL